MDEMFEVLTLSQTRKLDRRVPVLLYGSSYWKGLIDFEMLVREGMIDRADLDLFHLVDAPLDALHLLQKMLGSEQRPEAPSIAKSKTPVDPVPRT
jgi:predicted Rossmann-fold nucleotide-binding protein